MESLPLLVAIAVIFVPLLILIGLSVPVAFCFALVGMGLMLFLQGPKGLYLLMLGMYGTATGFVTVAVPLFIFMAEVALFSGVTARLFDAANKWMGRVPGGLPIATVASCAVFSAVTGSSVANASTIGLVAIPEMKKKKVDMGLAAGAIVAGGGLGILIPPSILFILYGILTEASVGQLFMAGLIPGIIDAIGYMAVIAVLVSLKPSLAPHREKFPFREKLKSAIEIWPVIALILLVLGTIYLGVCTPTESAALGAVGSIIISAMYKKLTLANFKNALLKTVHITCMALWILLGATAFASALEVSGIPHRIVEIVSNLDVSPMVLIISMNILVLLLGFVMESVGILMLVTPIFVPIIEALGFSPIWWGVVFCINIELALGTPPVGYNLFVIQGIAPDIPLKTIYKGVLPFFISDLTVLAFCIAFPQIVLWLPSHLY